MNIQPPIVQFAAGSWQPLGQNNWHLASQKSDVAAVVAQLVALGVSNATLIDMSNYTDPQGNFRNDIYGMFQYLDPNVKFWGIQGTVKLNPGTPAELDLPLYEIGGDVVDREAQPNAFFDKPAPVSVLPGGNTKPYPAGAKLNIQSYPSEMYATLYWSAQ